MSVIVRGMEMPADCRKCFMMDYGTMTGETYCKVNGKTLAESYRPIEFNGRPEWCPLVEIKTPHGDLIDRDAIENSVLKWLPLDPCGREEKEFPFETDICVSMMMEIEEQDAVIEAEGAEE